MIAEIPQARMTAARRWFGGWGWRAPRAVRRSLGSHAVLGKRPEEKKKEVGGREGKAGCGVRDSLRSCQGGSVSTPLLQL